MLNISLWEFISTFIVIISLVYNFIQYRARKKELKPIRHTLIGLLNDIKTKSAFCYQAQNVLFDPQNPHKEIATLRWEYSGLLFSITQALQGFQEHIVGLLKALEVQENEVIKAIDFGLSDQEKEAKELWWKNYKSRLQSPDQNSRDMKSKT